MNLPPCPNPNGGRCWSWRWQRVWTQFLRHQNHCRHCRTLISCTGMKSSPVLDQFSYERDARGRLVTDRFCRVPGATNIWPEGIAPLFLTLTEALALLWRTMRKRPAPTSAEIFCAPPPASRSSHIPSTDSARPARSDTAARLLIG